MGFLARLDRNANVRKLLSGFPVKRMKGRLKKVWHDDSKEDLKKIDVSRRVTKRNIDWRNIFMKEKCVRSCEC